MAFSRNIQFFVTLFLCIVHIRSDFPYKEAQFDQYIDHFNPLSFGEKKFQQRYLYQDKNWDPKFGPIFFYAGNEGPIEGFWEASGFIHEIAPQFSAYVVFPEHRFYGKSLPFGDQSFKNPNLGLLTMEQAMADYAYLLTDLKARINATEKTKIIAFGGSYGGMLAAYMRFKYPNIIDGALAASAPIFMQAVDGPHDFFFNLVTKDFARQGDKCVSRVREAFTKVKDLADKGQEGLDEISQKFHLCDKLTNQTAYRHLLGWARNAFTFMAMLDYPYPTGFLYPSLPGNPVKVACEEITAAPDAISGLVAATGIFYNITHDKKCFDIFQEFIECADPTGCGLGPSAKAWDYQACTECQLPAGSNNNTDMFPVLPWTQQMRADYCKKTFGVIPRESWPGIEFWGEKIKSASNIIWSNGDLDPWLGGGVTKSLSGSMPALLVEGGAHHLDLRAANKLDPPGVVKVRESEKHIIRSWLIS